MSWAKEGAIDAIRRVHEQMGDLEDVLADLEEVLERINELIAAIKEDIRNRDRNQDD